MAEPRLRDPAVIALEGVVQATSATRVVTRVLHGIDLDAARAASSPR